MNNPKSDIVGEGYGSDHSWKKMWSCPVIDGDVTKKRTSYVCNWCGCYFSHYYDIVPNIFDAMRQAMINEHCVTYSDRITG